jgi:hypothetical protein
VYYLCFSAKLKKLRAVRTFRWWAVLFVACRLIFGTDVMIDASRAFEKDIVSIAAFQNIFLPRADAHQETASTTTSACGCEWNKLSDGKVNQDLAEMDYPICMLN